MRGRVLVYWGCGEQARPGQPTVIDLAKPGAGAASLAAGLGTLTQTPPSPGAGRTYGEWPNARASKVPADGSLLGDHVVRGNYTPEIRFALGAGQDFLAPVQLSGTSPTAAGVTPLAWKPVTGAQAYFASVVGANEAGDTVIWSSSEIPLMAGQLPDHLSPADLKRLIARKALMAPQTTRCAVPAQVGQAAPASLLRVTAYGDEVDVSYPARPADPKTAWKPDYVVKVRYASIASAMLGLSDDAGEDDQDADAAQDTGKPAAGKKTRALLKGLGSILP
ncbi:hypothetical protein G3573_19490 [Caulobacter sp. 17J65-9]|nr:hypothetical protein [Caulobacter sp. 17J65-9]